MVKSVVAVAAEAHDAQRRSYGALARGQYRAHQQHLCFVPSPAMEQRGEGDEKGHNGVWQSEHGLTCCERWGQDSLPCSYAF